MIERGQTEGLMDKLDIFLTADRITREEYLELLKLLAQ